MRIDLSKIPRNAPYAIHIPSKEHARVFLEAMKEHYPHAVRTWDAPYYEYYRDRTGGGNYYYPRLHIDNPSMTHGDRDTYEEMEVKLLSFDDICVPDFELETELSDNPIEALLGGIEWSI